MWYFHYYAGCASKAVLGVPFEVIEQRVLGPRLFECAKFIECHGYIPRLRKPRTFSEKICNRKLFDRNPLFKIVADKFAVREFVTERIGSEILNELYFATTDVDEIPFDTLPDRFVIKATHGSGMNILVEDKSTIDVLAIKKKCREFLNTKYGALMNEAHYGEIPRRIIGEKFLGDEQGSPWDYRFHVYHGRCEFILTCVNRLTFEGRFYTRDWKPLDITRSYPLGPASDPPRNLSEMISVAETLAAEFDFMRVDLYSLGGDRIVFGEMTVTPGAGRVRYGPTQAAGIELGKYW